MTGPLFVLVWAAINFVLWVIYWAIFEPDWQGVSVYASGIGIIVLAAAWGAWRQRRIAAPADREPFGAPDVSHSAALLGIAAGMGALSLEFGVWLSYGAVLAATFAIGGLVREWRAQRRAERAVR